MNLTIKNSGLRLSENIYASESNRNRSSYIDDSQFEVVGISHLAQAWKGGIKCNLPFPAVTIPATELRSKEESCRSPYDYFPPLDK